MKGVYLTQNHLRQDNSKQDFLLVPKICNSYRVIHLTLFFFFNYKTKKLLFPVVLKTADLKKKVKIQ